MKEELVESVAAQAGLAPEKAEAAVDATLEFLKGNPAAVKELLSTGGSGVTSKLGSARAKVGPAVGEAKVKLTPVAERGKKAAGDAKVKLAPVAEKAGDRMASVGQKISEKARAAEKPAVNGAGPSDDATAGKPPAG